MDEMTSLAAKSQLANGDLASRTGNDFADATWSTAWSTGIDWTVVKSGDFDGDGNADLIGLDAASGQFYMSQSDGSSFTVSTWGSPIGNVSDFSDFMVGDFDGDGDDDLAFRDTTVAGNSGQWRLVVDEARWTWHE